MKDITIMYCGAFKPLTEGHLHIINTYLKHPNVRKLVLFLSPGKRDIVNSDDALEIINHLLCNKSIEVVLDKNSYSPILAVYRWIQNPHREPGKYALASSNKGDDYKRVKEFTKNYTPEKYAKNLPEGVKVIELPIDTEPLIYKTGIHKGETISATIIREDLKSDDFEKFKQNYWSLNEDDVKFIWNVLKK